MKSYRTGNPESDTALTWWQHDREDRASLRRILEQSGPREALEGLVDAAYQQGFIDDDLRDYLKRGTPRPAWAPGPWRIAQAVEAGEIHLPNGRLTAGDRYVFDRPPFLVSVPAGSYPVRVILASHPHAPTECAAAEVIIDPGNEPVAWSELHTPEPGGYLAEVGTASFGPPEALATQSILEQCDRDDFGYHCSWRQIDTNQHGSLVAFTVGPPLQHCRTWIGTNTNRSAVRVLTTSGYSGLDPTRDPALPW
ncbi:MAG: hypothetical protein ACR2JH_05500 [Solirubrobacteraceae bacterium]